MLENCNIGCAASTARVLDRLTGIEVCGSLLEAEGVEWEWTRAKSRASESYVQFESSCLPCLDSIEPWTHELEFERQGIDGFNRTWIGPIIEVDRNEEKQTVTVKALDRMSWLAKRVYQSDFNFSGDATDLFKTALEQAQIDDFVGLISVSDPTGVVLVNAFAEGDSIAESIDNIRGLIWFAMVGERLYAAPVSPPILGLPVTETWFQEDGYGSNRNGVTQANVIRIRYANGIAIWPPSGFNPVTDSPPGELAETFDYGDIESKSVALDIAKRLYEERRYPNFSIGNEELRLESCAPIDLTQIIPGLTHPTSINGTEFGNLTMDEIRVEGISTFETGAFVTLTRVTVDDRRVATL